MGRGGGYGSLPGTERPLAPAEASSSAGTSEKTGLLDGRARRIQAHTGLWAHIIASPLRSPPRGLPHLFATPRRAVRHVRHVR